MSWKAIIFIVFIWTIGQAISLIIDGAWLGGDEMTILNALTGYTTLEVSGSGIWTIPKLAAGFFSVGIPRLLLWDYSYLQGEAAAFKWFVLFPISAGVVYGFFTIVISAIQGILVRR